MRETEIRLIVEVVKGIVEGTGFGIGSLVFFLLLALMVLFFHILDYMETKKYHERILEKLENRDILFFDS